MIPKRDLIFFGIITLITSLAWVFFDAYHAYTNSTITSEKQVNTRLVPLNFDQEFLTFLAAARNQ